MFDGIGIQVDPNLVIGSLQNHCHTCRGLTPSARLQEPPNSTTSENISTHEPVHCLCNMFKGYQESSSLSVVLGEG